MSQGSTPDYDPTHGFDEPAAGRPPMANALTAMAATPVSRGPRVLPGEESPIIPNIQPEDPFQAPGRREEVG